MMCNVKPRDEGCELLVRQQSAFIYCALCWCRMNVHALWWCRMNVRALCWCRLNVHGLCWCRMNVHASQG